MFIICDLYTFLNYQIMMSLAHYNQSSYDKPVRQDLMPRSGGPSREAAMSLGGSPTRLTESPSWLVDDVELRLQGCRILKARTPPPRVSSGSASPDTSASLHLLPTNCPGWLLWLLYTSCRDNSHSLFLHKPQPSLT